MITFVRHVATDWSGLRYCGATDLNINARGGEQLAQLGRYLASVRPTPTLIVSSPARRCQQTAAAFAASFQLEVHLDGRLRECAFGHAEGMTFAQLAARWPQIAATLLRRARLTDREAKQGQGSPPAWPTRLAI